MDGFIASGLGFAEQNSPVDFPELAVFLAGSGRLSSTKCSAWARSVEFS
jgi:hypothetical protein